MKAGWYVHALQACLWMILACGLLASGTAFAALDIARLETLLNRGDLENAQQLVAESLKAGGMTASEASVANVIGWAYFSVGNVAQAEAHLKAALKSAEEHGETQVAMLAANNLGILNFTENRLDKAELYFGMGYNTDTDVAKEYGRLIEAKRRDTALTKALEQGKQQRYEQNFEQALASYDTVLALQPRNAAALEYKGYALFRLRRYDEANKALEDARYIDPSRLFVHLNLVKVACAQNSEDGVRQVLEQSGLPMQKFADWYQMDVEFREVCGGSGVVRKVVGQ